MQGVQRLVAAARAVPMDVEHDRVGAEGDHPAVEDDALAVGERLLDTAPDGARIGGAAEEALQR